MKKILPGWVLVIKCRISYVIYVILQQGFKPKSPVKTAVNLKIFVILSSTKPFKITPILLKYSYYVLP